MQNDDSYVHQLNQLEQMQGIMGENLDIFGDMIEGMMFCVVKSFEDSKFRNNFEKFLFNFIDSSINDQEREDMNKTLDISGEEWEEEEEEEQKYYQDDSNNGNDESNEEETEETDIEVLFDSSEEEEMKGREEGMEEIMERIYDQFESNQFLLDTFNQKINEHALHQNSRLDSSLLSKLFLNFVEMLESTKKEEKKRKSQQNSIKTKKTQKNNNTGAPLPLETPFQNKSSFVSPSIKKNHLLSFTPKNSLSSSISSVQDKPFSSFFTTPQPFPRSNLSSNKKTEEKDSIFQFLSSSSFQEIDQDQTINQSLYEEEEG